MTNFPGNIDPTDYPAWRRKKLSCYPRQPQQSKVLIDNIEQLSSHKLHQLVSTNKRYNFVFYHIENPEQNHKKAVHLLGKQLGLEKLDNNLCADADRLTSIEVRDNPGQHEYIPYTPKPLNWHTDGYYNRPENQINGVLLHCQRPAAEGGENFVLDHEIAWILLYDENPAYIKALSQPDALTIPANILDGKIIRAEQSGPVFSMLPSGALHMRYSARQRNIQWKNDAITQEAVQFLRELWESECPYIVRYRLEAGEGFISNNVLHARSAFRDHEKPENRRLLYRGRYFDRVLDSV